MRGNRLEDIKKAVEDLLGEVQKGETEPTKTHLVWEEMKKCKDAYVEQHSEQSWHTFIGNCFQKLVYAILKGYFLKLKSQEPLFQSLDVFSEKDVNSNEIVAKKSAIRYGKYFMLPDTDMAIVDYHFSDPWNSEILGIISCKTSMRERIAQACYWKLKLLSSDTTKNVRVFLATADNDKDFLISERSGQYEGKSRDRIIAEFELDGIYILRGDFKEEWESDKVKRYDRIFDDLVEIFKKIHKNS